MLPDVSVVGILILNFLQFTLLASFQDCKEFQGELFGVCNLFHDLSDKLFTSEIIELHEKQEHEPGIHHGKKQELTKLGNSFIPSKESGPASSSGSEIRITSDSKKASTSTPVLEDLGNFYFLSGHLCIYHFLCFSCFYGF